MEKRPISVLLIGDDPAFTEILERTTGNVKDFDLKFEKARSIDKGLKRLSKNGINVILLDLSIKGNKGLKTLDEVHNSAKDLPIVTISETYDEITVLKASKKGAIDYLHKKELTPDLLVNSLCCAFFKGEMEETIKRIQKDSKTEIDDRTEEVKKMYEQLIVELAERKRIENELRESEEKYRILVENANDGIVIVQDGLIKYINQRFFIMSGYKAEEMIDTEFVNYIHPDEVDKVIDRHKLRMQGDKVEQIYESAIRHKKGNKIYIECNVSTFSFKDKPALIAIVRDITERKKTEEELRATQDSLKQKADALNDRVKELD